MGIALCLSNIVPDSSIKDVRINRRQNIVAVELTEPDKDNISKLLGITEMGKHSVKGHRASEGIKGPHCSGVISPIGMETDLEALKHLVRSTEKVIKVTRLLKFSGGVKEESTAVRLDFEGRTLPEKIKLGYMSYEVREFNPPPLRCYRCQRFGHMSGGCTAAERCMICSGNHKKSNCMNKDNPKCANCGEAHVASSRICILNTKASEINRHMRQGKPFLEAKRIVDARVPKESILTFPYQIKQVKSIHEFRIRKLLLQRRHDHIAMWLLVPLLSPMKLQIHLIIMAHLTQ